MSSAFTDTLHLANLPAIKTAYPHPDDFHTRALAMRLRISMLMEELIWIVNDAAPHCPHLDRKELVSTIKAYCTDLEGDVAGAFDKAADLMTDALYEGCARGPMHRSRP